MSELEQSLEELEAVKQSFKANIDNTGISTSSVEFRNMPNLIRQMEKKLPEQSKVVTPKTSEQNVSADVGYKLTSVKVGAVTKDIDTNIQANNIKKGVDILGVTGTLEATSQPVLQEKTVAPDVVAKSIEADDGYDGLRKVNLLPVTSAIDKNIKAENIKEGETILGVTGTFQGGIQPSGTIKLDTNGIHNVADYEFADVAVISGGDLNVAQRTLGALDFSEGNIELLPNFSMGGVLDLSKDIKVTNDDDTGAYDETTGYYRFYIPNSNDVDIYAKVYFSVPIDGDVTFDLYGKENSSWNDKYIAVSNLDSVIPKKDGSPDENSVYSLVKISSGSTISSTVTFNNVPAGEHFVIITAGVDRNSSFELLIKSIVVPENTSDATALSKLTIVKPLALKPENIVGGNVVMGVMGNAGTMATAINDGTTEIFDTGAVTTIRPYAFYQHSTLTNVSFPACSSIGISAFQLCSQLSSANFPKCQYIGSSAFANCTKLTNVSFPAVLSLGTEIWRSAPISMVYLPECSDVGIAFRNATAIKAIDLPKVTIAGNNCFGGMSQLVSANLPECSYLLSGAFSGCNNLTDLNIPKLTSLSGGAQFFSCYKLSYFNMGNISSITGNMFAYCSALSSVDADNVTYVGTQAFVGCRTLPTINLPQCSVVSNGAFTNCSVLSTINIPLCEQLGSSAFSSCSALTTIDIPLCEQIGSYAFYSCTALTKIDLPVASSIGSRAFYFCSKLSTIIIGSSSCRLWNTDALQQTPMNNSTYLGYFGSIYVPADYVDYYKTSQYWSTYSSRITSIENLPTE